MSRHDAGHWAGTRHKARRLVRGTGRRGWRAGRAGGRTGHAGGRTRRAGGSAGGRAGQAGARGTRAGARGTRAGARAALARRAGRRSAACAHLGVLLGCGLCTWCTQPVFDLV